MNDGSYPSRRELLKGATVALGGVALGGNTVAAFADTMAANSTFTNLLRHPDLVLAFGPEGHGLYSELPLEKLGDAWAGAGSQISTVVGPDGLRVFVNGGRKISRIQLRWQGDLSGIKKYLGDHWERSYADLEWRGEAPNRTMPWYFMAFDGKRTHGYGVKTGPGAFCFWNADVQGISLWLDIRAGGVPVELGDRLLEAATVVQREGKDGESAFAATTAFCHQMCPTPRLADHAIYGTNDWNYAYGRNSAELIAGVSGLISELSPDTDNRPYSVIDEGWAMGPYGGNFGHGPWVGNPNFGDMGAFAHRLKGLGVRPGIWFRPLTPLEDSSASWMLHQPGIRREDKLMDPTIPEVEAHVADHMKRFVDWGYEMVKHDFTTWDIMGAWGFEMGPSPTRDGWKFHDSSRTSAEVIAGLYKTIRDAAGSVRLIGCNTVSHLSAGYHEVQRIGDDTSGRSWNRNRRMGVNTLAFRAPQHHAFYTCDPDIVAITKAVSWDLVEQWLRLVSESGTALFVAVEPSVVEPKHKVALKKALGIAAKQQPIGEALDWMETETPRHWRLLGKDVSFRWMDRQGPWPFGD